MKPATPLPWKSTKRSMQLGVSNIWITANGKRVFNGAEGRHRGNIYVPVPPEVVADMDYAAHAANAYPKLVDAVRRMPQLAFEPSNNGERWDEGYKAGFYAAMERAFTISQSLLRELKEVS